MARGHDVDLIDGLLSTLLHEEKKKEIIIDIYLQVLHIPKYLPCSSFGVVRL